jgi:Icc-related predicted phosphoesterase
MKIAAIGDTHGIGFYRPPADLFIHAGDMTSWGDWKETAVFGQWLSKEPIDLRTPAYDGVILVPGNHDEAFGTSTKNAMFPFGPNVHLLIDQAWEYKGLVFYGSPWVPTPTDGCFLPHARTFTGSEEDLRRHFLNIPAEVDVLVTHGPPKGILDNGKGSEALREAVEMRTVRRHIFGHIHECGGRSALDKHCLGEGWVRHSHNVSAILPPFPFTTRPPLVFEVEP